MKSYDLVMKMWLSLTACEQNEKKPTSDYMLIKLIDFWPKTLVMSLVVFSSFFFSRRAIKQDVLISF